MRKKKQQLTQLHKALDIFCYFLVAQGLQQATKIN